MTRGGAARTAAGGAAAAAAYLAAAWASFQGGLLPVRPLYDGTAPPAPYRWVTPPENLAAANQAPLPGAGTVELAATGPLTVSTSDLQAVLTIPAGGFRAEAGETHVAVRIEPLDAATLGEPPDGFHYDGNAYRVTATYQKSGSPAELSATSCPGSGEKGPPCATVVLRYAFGATALFRREGSAWEKVEGGGPVAASLQVFSTTPRLGSFVATAPGAGGAGGGWRIYAGAGAGAAALVAAGASRRARKVVRRSGRWLSEALFPRRRPRSGSKRRRR